MEELKELGIEENTLVVMMSDNGPMTHNGPPGMVETLYTGRQGRLPRGRRPRTVRFARWPGVIEPEGQIVGDIIHETDLFTTFARLGGATDHIPTDPDHRRHVDQTALLLLNGDS